MELHFWPRHHHFSLPNYYVDFVYSCNFFLFRQFRTRLTYFIVAHTYHHQWTTLFNSLSLSSSLLRSYSLPPLPRSFCLCLTLSPAVSLFVFFLVSPQFFFGSCSRPRTKESASQESRENTFRLSWCESLAESYTTTHHLLPPRPFFRSLSLYVRTGRNPLYDFSRMGWRAWTTKKREKNPSTCNIRIPTQEALLYDQIDILKETKQNKKYKKKKKKYNSKWGFGKKCGFCLEITRRTKKKQPHSGPGNYTFLMTSSFLKKKKGIVWLIIFSLK